MFKDGCVGLQNYWILRSVYAIVISLKTSSKALKVVALVYLENDERLILGGVFNLMCWIAKRLASRFTVSRSTSSRALTTCAHTPSLQMLLKTP